MSHAPSPGILDQLCRVWGVDQALARRLLFALYRSKWTEVRAWRQAVLLAERVGDRRPVAEALLSPAAIIRIVELLTQERRLGHRDRVRLEAGIFRCTDAAGGWK